MDIHTAANCELLVLSKLSSYAFLCQLFVLNNPADPAGYIRSLYSILVSYIIIMYIRDYQHQEQNAGGGQQNVLELIKAHGLRLFFDFWAYLIGLVAYSVLGQIGGWTVEDAFLVSCSSWDKTPVHLLPWNTITIFYNTIETLTSVRFGHVFVNLIYYGALYGVQKLQEMWP